MDFEQWVSRYPETRREQLRLARATVQQIPLNDLDALVKCFLKIETSTKNTDPRNISPRSDRFLSILGPYISSLEHEMARLPFLIKGLDRKARARKLRILNGYTHFAEIDYSRFDQSINHEIINHVEHTFLTLPFDDDADSNLFRICLHFALVTKGISEVGIRYTKRGSRCSGDAHTSIANAIVNIFLTFMALSDVPPDKWTAFVEGDDGVVGLDDDTAKQMDERFSIIPTLGFGLKIEKRTGIQMVTFCGTFLTNDGYYSDPFRSLAKFGTALGDGDVRALLLAKAYSYAYLNDDTPMIGAICRCVVRCLGHIKVSNRVMEREMKTMYNLVNMFEGPVNYKLVRERFTTREPSAEKRAAFALRTGLSPRFQVEYEKWWDRQQYIPSTLPRLPGEVTLDNNGTLTGDVNEFML